MLDIGLECWSEGFIIKNRWNGVGTEKIERKHFIWEK